MGIASLFQRQHTLRIRSMGEPRTNVSSQFSDVLHTETRWPRIFPRLCAEAAVSRRSLVIWGWALLLCSGACAISALTLLSFLPLIFPCIVVLILYLVLQRKAFLRAEAFERDYTALLLTLASSIKTGVDPGAALLRARELFPKSSVVAQELSTYSSLLDSGESEESAMGHFAHTISHPDVVLFREAFLLARREGSSISETLYRLLRVTRQRQSFRRKTRAAVAMQKLSAFGIVGCAVAVGVFQLASHPARFLETLRDPLGQKMLYAGGGVIIAGVIWMIRMCKVKV